MKVWSNREVWRAARRSCSRRENLDGATRTVQRAPAEVAPTRQTTSLRRSLTSAVAAAARSRVLKPPVVARHRGDALGTSMSSLSLGCAQLSAAFNPATCLHRSRAFAHAPVHPTSAAVPAHRRARVVAWTTSWRARNLTATRAVAEPRGSSANKEDDWDEDEDEVEDDEGFDDDHDGPALGGDRFVKMTHTELLVMTPEQRKEYHKRSVLEGQIAPRRSARGKKVSQQRTVRPAPFDARGCDAFAIARHFTVFAFRVINQYWHQPETTHTWFHGERPRDRRKQFRLGWRRAFNDGSDFSPRTRRFSPASCTSHVTRHPTASRACTD